MVKHRLGAIVRCLWFTLIVLFTACTGKKDDTDKACSESQPEACLYTAESSYAVEKQTVSINDTERIGGTRPVSLWIYDPTDIEDALPTLFLTPGGPLGTGQNPAAKSAETWAQTLASAGYLVIVIEQRGRSETSKRALCEALDIAENQCDAFKSETWDAPKDVVSALNWLRSNQADNQWMSRTQGAAIGHVGQERGASTSLMLAGADRAFGGIPYDFSDSRIEAIMPIALVAENNSSSFLDTGLADVEVPVYMTGGVNGYQSSNVPIDTPDAFSTLPAGDKYLLHFLDDDADIATFQLNDTGCPDCEAFVSWVRTSSVAFADAQLTANTEAVDWLASENMTVAIGSQAEWLTR